MKIDMFGLFQMLKGIFTRMRIFRCKTALLICVLWIIFGFALWVFLRYSTSKVKVKIDQHLTRVLWWTSMPSIYETTRFCGIRKCLFSTDRLKLAEARAVLFYASDLLLYDFPLPRLNKHLWALLHEESPRNVPFLPHAFVMQHFNFSSTFSRYSDFPLTTQYLPSIRDLISPAFVVGMKSNLRSGRAPIAFLQSDCDTMSSRDDYVRALMQHIDIDSYGKCLHNKDLPKSLQTDYLNNLYSPELNHFLSGYKFILAYENGVCDDYITEKFWRPLIIGAIPIYFGSPTIKDWQPNNKSVIHISDFATPKALADFIKSLDENDYEYNTYLNHKYEQLEPISNPRLLKALLTREYSMADGNLFNAFECFVCESVLKKLRKPAIVTLSHYNCTNALSHPPMEEHNIISGRDGGHWPSVMAMGKCQGRILDTLLRRNKPYTKEEFDELLMVEVEANRC